MNILKKKAVAFICVLTLTISCSIVLPGCSEKNKYTFDGVPEEFTVCLENALDALKESGAASVPFSYFPNEELKSAREGANGNLISYTIDSAQKINDNLYAYEVTMELAETPGEKDVYYKFVGNIDGEILYIGNPNWVPESIGENYESEDFQNPIGENTLSSGNSCGRRATPCTPPPKRPGKRPCRC